MTIFTWEKTKQLTVIQILLAFFVPSLIAYAGFRLLLPSLVNRGVSVLAGYSTVASSMLFLFLLAAFVIIKKESLDLDVKLSDRLCLKKLTGKQIILSILITVATMSLSLAAGPASVWIINTFSLDLPEFYPFFLDPRIDPATADPMVLTSGIDVSGRWGLFLLFPLTLTLNILTEEVYFRAWLLPKMTKFGKWSWVLNGFLFALYHTYQLWLFPVLLTASLGFAFLNYKMRSIVPSVIAHFLLNTMSIIGLAPLFMSLAVNLCLLED